MAFIQYDSYGKCKDFPGKSVAKFDRQYLKLDLIHHYSIIVGWLLNKPSIHNIDIEKCDVIKMYELSSWGGEDSKIQNFQFKN